jgi:quinol-cytochrome oxidoreductase complex cytochrome b subunit
MTQLLLLLLLHVERAFTLAELLLLHLQALTVHGVGRVDGVDLIDLVDGMKRVQHAAATRLLKQHHWLTGLLLLLLLLLV